MARRRSSRSISTNFSSSRSSESSSQLDTAVSSPADSGTDNSSSEETLPATKRKKYNYSYRPSQEEWNRPRTWSREFKRLEFDTKDEKKGLPHKLCCKHNKHQVLCFTLRKDKIKKHESSCMNKAAEKVGKRGNCLGILRSYYGRNERCHRLLQVHIIMVA